MPTLREQRTALCFFRQLVIALRFDQVTTSRTLIDYNEEVATGYIKIVHSWLTSISSTAPW